MVESAAEQRMAATEQPHSALVAQVREYWNANVHAWKVARFEPGSREFFEETEAYRFEKLHYLPRLVDFNSYSGKRLLDVGCGLGNDLARFAAAGADVVGIDLAERAIELARANFQQRNLVGRFHVMNGETLEFPDNSFDLVYCHTVLHFTPGPRKLVQEIHRVMKPDGEAIIMTINRRSWLTLLQLAMKVETDYLDAPVFNSFTIREFRELLTPFSNVRIVPERFPVRTKVHHGLKATLFNSLFVDVFNALPKTWVKWTGHHLLAFGTK